MNTFSGNVWICTCLAGGPWCEACRKAGFTDDQVNEPTQLWLEIDRSVEAEAMRPEDV